MKGRGNGRVERNESVDEIRNILAGYTDAEVVKEARLIEDLGLDSFLIVYFLTEVESRFGIELDEEKFVDMVTVNDVLEWVCRAGKSAGRADD